MIKSIDMMGHIEDKEWLEGSYPSFEIIAAWRMDKSDLA